MPTSSRKPVSKPPTKEVPLVDWSGKKQKWVCLACHDTGKNSQGNPCHPCVVMGRVKVRKLSLFE